MNAKEIIKLSAIYLQMEEVLELDIFGGAETVQSESVAKDVELLTRCLNLVYSEIATDYIPLKITESIEVINGQIELSSLTKKLVSVVKIADQNLKNAKFKIYPSLIEIENGEYGLTYNYLPESVTIDESLESFSGKLTERIVAYGVASEFALISGLYNEAEIWEKRFKDAILVAKRTKTDVVLPARRWL